MTGSIIAQVVLSGLLLGAVYALFSSGLTLVWGMMNVINFAHGDMVMAAMYVALVVWKVTGHGPALAVPMAAVVLGIFGVLVYLLLIRRIMQGPLLAQIIGTFGLLLLVRYSIFWIFGSDFKSLPEGLAGGNLAVAGLRIQVPRLLAGVVALLLTIGLHLLMTRTRMGSRMMAVAEDEVAAQLVGVRPNRMQALGWALAAASAGVAGALIANFFYLSPTVGETFLILAFVVVALGGFGSIPGALIAGLLIGVVESLSAYFIGPVYKDVVVYGLFVLVLWVRPRGLMGRAA